ncbi:unnamed protein product [Malus baccata var. baccata]
MWTTEPCTDSITCKQPAAWILTKSWRVSPTRWVHMKTPPTNPSVEYPSWDSYHVSKRTMLMGLSTEVNLPVNMLPVTFSGHGHGQALNAPDDLPKNVTQDFESGFISHEHGFSSFTADFSSWFVFFMFSSSSLYLFVYFRALQLFGTNVGHVGLWEVGSRERLVLRNFKVWDLSSCSMLLQAALVKDAGVSVNRVIWSSDGALFGKLGHTEVTVANVIWLYQFLRIELDPNRCISFTIQLSVVANN